MSDLLAALLHRQLTDLRAITEQRKLLCERYKRGLNVLESKGALSTCRLTSEGNGHIFYIMLKDRQTTDSLRRYLGGLGILACTHYVPLHTSDYYKRNFPAVSLPNAEAFWRASLKIAVIL